MVPVEDGRPGGAATVQVIQGTAPSHVTTTRHIPSLHPRPTYDRPAAAVPSDVTRFLANTRLNLRTHGPRALAH